MIHVQPSDGSLPEVHLRTSLDLRDATVMFTFTEPMTLFALEAEDAEKLALRLLALAREARALEAEAN